MAREVTGDTRAGDEGAPLSWLDEGLNFTPTNLSPMPFGSDPFRDDDEVSMYERCMDSHQCLSAVIPFGTLVKQKKKH